MIKISVITCTYNGSLTITSTVTSVLSQKYEAVEHIIVDGASTDGTLEIVGRYKDYSDFQDNGHKVTILSEPDDGLYFAMNKAIDMATGDYMVFLNSGDYFPDEYTLYNISRCVKNENQLPGVIYGDTDLVDSEGNMLRRRRLSPPEKLTWRSFSNGMLVCHQAFYALTSIAKVTPYNTKYRYSADVDWCIRVMKEAKKENRELKNAHLVVANYLSEGLTTQNHKASLRERFDIMKNHYGIVITLWKHLWFSFRIIVKQ